jgi:hypothetical protein
MLKETLKKLNNINLIKSFETVDVSDFPDFYNYSKPLEQGLWVLWVSKEKLQIKKLSAEQISKIIREVKEVSIDEKSISTSFNRAGKKVHPYKEEGVIYYEIMKAGKEYLLSNEKTKSMTIFYFEPDKNYSSKRLLVKRVLSNLKGELRIVDPYSDLRTLDVMSSVKNKILFMSKLKNFNKTKDRDKFLRELQDFKTEHSNIEFRDYPNNDIHDRYIISDDLIVILGHSIKDLGGKESFAIVLNKRSSKNIHEALVENFNRRWKISNTI